PDLTASSSSTSASSTGTWPASDPILREQPPVLVAERLLLEAVLEPLEVPNREVVVLSEHAHVARHRRAVAQRLRDHDAARAVECAWRAEEFHGVEEAQLGGMRAGHRREATLDLEPHGHRVEPHELARHARDEDLEPPLRLDRSAEAVRDLQPSLV